MESGAVVLHDADAKREYMLMHVIGYGKDGLCQTRYLASGPAAATATTVWENDIKYLHAPARFGFTANAAGQTPAAQENR